MNNEVKYPPTFDLEEINRRRWESFPACRFLKLVNEEWKTPNFADFFVFRDDPISEVGGFIAGCVSLNRIGSTYLPDDIMAKYSVHISMIGIADEFRRCGFLGYVCSRMISWADEAGVFLYGHARAFEYPIPLMHTPEETMEWLSRRDSFSPHQIGLKKEMVQSKNLHKKYIEYGFRRFDGAGLRFANRQWKRTCFGHMGENLESNEMRSFLNLHLKNA